MAWDRHLKELCKETGITTDLILIKLLSAFQGIQVERSMRSSTLSVTRGCCTAPSPGRALAESSETLISCFVWHMLYWHVTNMDKKLYEFPEDHWVRSDTKIYKYYEKHSYKVMDASLCNACKIKVLAGCNVLTILSKLLRELRQTMPMKWKYTWIKSHSDGCTARTRRPWRSFQMQSTSWLPMR